MSEDIYTNPEADLNQETVVEDKFYVVAPVKFFVLYFVTFGLYPIYWFYKNWKQLKIVTGRKVIPFLRGLFSIFFAIQLFRAVDVELKERELGYAWKPDTLSIAYIVLMLSVFVGKRLASRGIGNPYMDYYGLIVLPVMGYLLYRAQVAINLAAGDPEGYSNRRFSWANMIWIVIGGLFWVMALAGAVLILIHH